MDHNTAQLNGNYSKACNKDPYEPISRMESKKVLEQLLSPRHPVIFSDDDWDYDKPLAIGSMYGIFTYMYIIKINHSCR